MPELGNVKESDLFPKVIKTLSGKFWVVMCYEKNSISYLHNLIGQDVHNTPSKAILASKFAPDQVINNYT